MKAEKTIKCRIINPNKGKLKALVKEYEKVQQYIQGDDEVELYSSTTQAVNRYTDWDSIKHDKEYPWYLRNDVLKVSKSKNTSKFDYWANIPVKEIRGGITVPVIPHEEIKFDSIDQQKWFI